MNDRFRFRAWYKDLYSYEPRPRMLYDAEQTYDALTGRPEAICEECFGSLLDDEEYIVEQCTGLKDKNGRLIYEGDIVRLTRRKDNILQKRGSCFQIRYLTHRFCGFGYGVNNRSVDMCLTERKAKCLEVIGNIHENPELLEAGK